MKASLKPVSIAFVFAQLFDALSTLMGLTLYPQIAEANPLLGALGGWLPTLLLKTVISIIVVILLQRVNWSRLIWLVPTAAALPIIWNIANIVAEAIL